MQFIQSYIDIVYTLFILSFWGGVSILLYHIKKFGLGVHAKRIFLLIIIGSIFLSVFSIIIYIRFKTLS